MYNLVVSFLEDIIKNFTSSGSLNGIGDLVQVAFVFESKMPGYNNLLDFFIYVSLLFLVIYSMITGIHMFLLSSNDNGDTDLEGFVVRFFTAVIGILMVKSIWVVILTITDLMIKAISDIVSFNVASIGNALIGIGKYANPYADWSFTTFTDVNIIVPRSIVNSVTGVTLNPGSPEYETIKAGIENNNGSDIIMLIGLLILCVIFLKLWFDVMIRGAEISIYKLVGPIFMIDLINSDRNMSVMYFKEMMTNSFTLVLQVMMFYLMIFLIMAQTNIFIVIAFAVATSKMPKILEKYTLTYGGNMSGKITNAILMMGRLRR